MKELMQQSAKVRVRIQALHRYYRFTGFYSFIKSSIQKSIWPIITIILLLLGIDLFILDLSDLLNEMVAAFSPEGVFLTFFISESFLGLLPPEIFVAWSLKSAFPKLFLLFIATLSFTGGIISYGIGRLMVKVDFINNYLNNRLAKNIKNVRKWGGLLIAAGALLPIPFSITCIAAGLVNYRFKNLLLFGSLRFVRYSIYAGAAFSMAIA